ncbi:hypothetical protein DPX39_010047100 [Trypanosoma brucei equiperdum]|uniref:Uncharacterized protein n=1 Tax=Trypanosoma brucei equiperdum TaxID=630700 RepID=A0A3L6LDN5_9TRYP|nr:hypothetical protein DPX39_010047100 [Trypanosoma brucei equiperdum]
MHAAVCIATASDKNSVKTSGVSFSFLRQVTHLHAHGATLPILSPILILFLMFILVDSKCFWYKFV